MAKQDETFAALKAMVIAFGVDAFRGCTNPTYQDFENGNGEPVGIKMQKALERGRRVIQKHTQLIANGTNSRKNKSDSGPC